MKKPLRGRRIGPALVGVDYVKEVTHKEPFLWDEKDQQSASFNLIRGNAALDSRNVRDAMPPPTFPSSPTISG